MGYMRSGVELRRHQRMISGIWFDRPAVHKRQEPGWRARGHSAQPSCRVARKLLYLLTSLEVLAVFHSGTGVVMQYNLDAVVIATDIRMSILANSGRRYREDSCKLLVIKDAYESSSCAIPCSIDRN